MKALAQPSVCVCVYARACVDICNPTFIGEVDNRCKYKTSSLLFVFVFRIPLHPNASTLSFMSFYSLSFHHVRLVCCLLYTLHSQTAGTYIFEFLYLNISVAEIRILKICLWNWFGEPQLSISHVLFILFQMLVFRQCFWDCQCQ